MTSVQSLRAEASDGPLLRRHALTALSGIDRAACWLTEAERSPSTKKLFRNLLYAWVFLHSALLFPFLHEVYGVDALVLRETFDGSLFAWIFRIFLIPGIDALYPVLYFGQLALLVLGMAGYWPRLISVLVCVATLNLNALAPSMLDGGNNLSELLLVYLVLVDTSGRPREATSTWSRLAIAVSNAGLVLLRLQVVVVYLTAGMLKLNGELWQRGMALYYILQADAFSHPWMNKIVISWPWVGMLGTYTTLLFQWLFPTMVWFRRTRPFILTLGVMLHLGIAFGMGLLTFGLIMCLVYVLFLEERTTARVLAWFSAKPVLEAKVLPNAARLLTVVQWLAKLAPTGSVLVVKEAPGPEPGAGAALVAVRELPAPGEERSRLARRSRQSDVLALLRLACRCRWLWPLAPVMLAVVVLWYVGLGQRFFHRSFAPGEVVEPDAGVESVA